jgi:PLP dependent protein
MSAIKTGMQAVRARIAAAAEAAGRRPDDIELIAVSKTFPAQAVTEAVRCGQRAFGENYAQEGVAKMLAVRNELDLSPEPILWHFIGPIQSNKTRLIAENFDWVHSVDRLRIAERLSEQRPPHLPPLNICLQVNVSGEHSKSGVAPEQAVTLAEAVAVLPRLRLRGLMTIPAPASGEAAQRVPFAQMHALLIQLNATGMALDTLSMGMSDDFPAAIREGATIVRIGSAIFGARDYGGKK